MKGVDKFIFSIISKLESLRQGIISFAYYDSGIYWVCVNDYDLYMNDEKFKLLRNTWYVAGKALGIKTIFIFKEPTEEFLLKLADMDNLFLIV